MAQDVPAAGEESRSSCQGITRLDRGVQPRPREVFQIHPVVCQRIPQSVTSLTIDTSVVTLVQIRDIIAKLPNLDDLSLSGYLVPDPGRALVGAGTTLKGRFGGKLLLRNDCADKDLMNMLLEIASGLRFTAVHIRCGGECILTTVRLVEACSKTLVKLSYMVTFHGKYHSSSWPSQF